MPYLSRKMDFIQTKPFQEEIFSPFVLSKGRTEEFVILKAQFRSSSLKIIFVS